MKRQEEDKKKNKGGRTPKLNPSIFRHTVNFTAEENARFLKMFDYSEIKNISKFIGAMIFGREMKVVKIDKATMDYYMRLTNFHSQFRAVGVNYNQIVKALNSNFSEKRAVVLLRQLEKATIELVKINQKVMELTEEFEKKHLDKMP